MSISHILGTAAANVSHFLGTAKANVSAILGATASFGGGADTDATAFLTATGITDPTISSAINQLVLDMKAAGVWSKCIAIYPFVGGDAAKHSYNLKNPAAYQITWNGAITHDGNGITGDGSSGYGDTGYNQNTHGTANDEHVGVYVRTNSANPNIYEIGVSGAAATSLRCLDSSSQIRALSQNATTGFVTSITTSAGLTVISRTVSTEYRVQRNASSTTISNSSTGRVNGSFFILARNAGGSASGHSNRNIAFATIGLGLTAAEAGDYFTAIEAFQDALSRGVV